MCEQTINSSFTDHRICKYVIVAVPVRSIENRREVQTELDLFSTLCRVESNNAILSGRGTARGDVAMCIKRAFELLIASKLAAAHHVDHIRVANKIQVVVRVPWMVSCSSYCLCPSAH